MGHTAPHEPINPSVNLRDNKEAINAFASTSEAEEVLNWYLAFTHPELYQIGSQLRDVLRNKKENCTIAGRWGSVFNGISVISNGVTPEHRDRGGAMEWFELLLSIGTARNLTLKLPDISFNVPYSPRTVVFVCGKLLSHSVELWESGERVCWAHFIRPAVVKCLNIGDPATALWSCIDNYVEQ
jgi:hypothetical protein